MPLERDLVIALSYFFHSSFFFIFFLYQVVALPLERDLVIALSELEHGISRTNLAVSQQLRFRLD